MFVAALTSSAEYVADEREFPASAIGRCVTRATPNAFKTITKDRRFVSTLFILQQSGVG